MSSMLSYEGRSLALLERSKSYYELKYPWNLGCRDRRWICVLIA